MNDELTNIVIEQLKEPRAEVAAVKADTGEMRSRMAQVETGTAGLRRDFVHADENAAILSVRIDADISATDR